jgi:hypothetical protein
MEHLPDSFLVGIKDGTKIGDLKNMSVKDFRKCVTRNQFPPLFIERLQLLRKLQLSNVSIIHISKKLVIVR